MDLHTIGNLLINNALSIIMAAFIAWTIKAMKDINKKIDAYNDGLVALLYNTLVDYNKFVDENGYTDLEHKQKAQNIYAAYHTLGGNGVGTEMYENILNAPTHKVGKE